MDERAFICQISREDWKVSRSIGVYGNREGSERGGKIKYFKCGSPTVQSIIEDLVGMRKGDLVFFHVIGGKEESSIHGVYIVRKEPFYNNQKLDWKSKKLVYPYRFCFEPHPDHKELCKYDANISVSQFYAAIETGIIHSILTLEREERGAAHAVKTITREDAKEIIKLLYKEFSTRRSKQPVNFNPLQITGPSLKNCIRRVGELEFSVKAVVAYKLGHEDHTFTKLIPACRNKKYDFLIQNYIGQTIRKPVDFVCIGYGNSEKSITIIEVKKDKATLDHLVQLLKYQEVFRIRNVGKEESLNYKFSPCLLAKDFQSELKHYCSLRNMFIPWEKVILIKYNPINNGRDASFTEQTLPEPSLLSLAIHPPPKIPKTDISQILSNPQKLYPFPGKERTPKTGIEVLPEKDVVFLRKYYQANGLKSTIGYVLIYFVDGKCGVNEFKEFMKHLYRKAIDCKQKFMDIEPILIAEDYDKLVTSFIEEYNKYETRAMRQPISYYVNI